MRAPLRLTVHGRRCLESPEFRQQVLKIYQQMGRRSTIIYLATVLILADENGVFRADNDLIARAVNENQTELNAVLHQIITVN